jgi:hypothetical protein
MQPVELRRVAVMSAERAMLMPADSGAECCPNAGVAPAPGARVPELEPASTAAHRSARVLQGLGRRGRIQ